MAIAGARKTRACAGRHTDQVQSFAPGFATWTISFPMFSPVNSFRNACGAFCIEDASRRECLNSQHASICSPAVYARAGTACYLQAFDDRLCQIGEMNGAWTRSSLASCSVGTADTHHSRSRTAVCQLALVDPLKQVGHRCMHAATYLVHSRPAG